MLIFVKSTYLVKTTNLYVLNLRDFSFALNKKSEFGIPPALLLAAAEKHGLNFVYFRSACSITICTTTF